MRDIHDMQVSTKIDAQKAHQASMLNSCKETMLLLASNLKTVTILPFRTQQIQNQFGEKMQDTGFETLNSSLKDQERQDIRCILDMYFNLFETSSVSPQLKNSYTLAPLSHLIAGEIPTL
jgi:hypothetical protein